METIAKYYKQQSIKSEILDACHYRSHACLSGAPVGKESRDPRAGNVI